MRYLLSVNVVHPRMYQLLANLHDPFYVKMVIVQSSVLSVTCNFRTLRRRSTVWTSYLRFPAWSGMQSQVVEHSGFGNRISS